MSIRKCLLLMVLISGIALMSISLSIAQNNTTVPTITQAVQNNISSVQRPTGEIIVFTDSNLGGSHTHFFIGEPDLSLDPFKTFNDAISSFVVVSGNWILYKDKNYQIPYKATFGPGIYRDVTWYGVENDAISSLRPAA